MFKEISIDVNEKFKNIMGLTQKIFPSPSKNRTKLSNFRNRDHLLSNSEFYYFSNKSIFDFKEIFVSNYGLEYNDLFLCEISHIVSNYVMFTRLFEMCNVDKLIRTEYNINLFAFCIASIIEKFNYDKTDIL